MKHIPLVVLGLLLVGQASATAQVPGFEHFAERDGRRIAVWERVLPGTREGVDETGRVVLFLHGATWSGRPCFDLELRDLSTLQHFARAGWDAFSVDVQGYGASGDPVEGNPCNALEAAEDVLAAIELVGELRGVERVHLVGWSWGSLVAGEVARRWPDRVASLVLYGSRYQPFSDPPDPPTERFRTNTEEAAAQDFVEGYFEEDVRDAFVEAALAADPVSPNGSLVDYFANLPVLQPTVLSAPTLVIVGEHEAQYTLADQLALFEALAPTDKRLVVVPGGGHAIHLESGRDRWRSAVLEFLEGVRR